MPDTKLTLIKGDETESNVDYRDQLPVNMYAVEKDILNAKGYMLTYPGLDSFGTVIGLDRGAIYNERQTNHFRVSGIKFIEISTGGISTTLGTISGTKQVALPYSFNTQAIIADGRMWLYGPTDGFVEITDSDLGNPIDGVWVDGYYFLTDGEYIYHTDIDDETSIDSLQFSTALFSPDPTLGVSKTQDNKVMVWGRYSLEYFVNVATDDFAFQRIETRAQKIGIVATHAKCEAKGQFYITGGREKESVAVYIITVGKATKISIREVDKLIAKYTEPELIDMRMESRVEDDVTFITIHLPDITLCFNDTIFNKFGKEVAWSILKTGTSTTTYRGINGIFDSRISNWIYGDKFSNIIGKLDKSICTQYGNKIEWLLYTPFLNIETKSIDSLEIETIPGFNIVDDATVAISATYNGIIYSQEQWITYSTINDYSKRFIIRRLGYVRDWIGFKFRTVTSSRMAFALCRVFYG